MNYCLKWKRTCFFDSSVVKGSCNLLSTGKAFYQWKHQKLYYSVDFSLSANLYIKAGIILLRDGVTMASEVVVNGSDAVHQIR